MPGKKKKYNARFPPARIKKIMQTDEEVGKVAAPVPVIISRALELFAEALLARANDVTLKRGARTLTTSHLKLCIENERRFDFLRELVSTVPDLQDEETDFEGEVLPLQPSRSKPRGRGQAFNSQLNLGDRSEATARVTANPPARVKQTSNPPARGTGRRRGRPPKVNGSVGGGTPRPKPAEKRRYVDETLYADPAVENRIYAVVSSDEEATAAVNGGESSPGPLNLSTGEAPLNLSVGEGGVNIPAATLHPTTSPTNHNSATNFKFNNRIIPASSSFNRSASLPTPDPSPAHQPWTNQDPSPWTASKPSPAHQASHQLPSHQLPSNQMASHQMLSQQLPSNLLPSHQLPSQQLPSHQLPSHQLPPTITSPHIYKQNKAVGFYGPENGLNNKLKPIQRTASSPAPLSSHNSGLQGSLSGLNRPPQPAVNSGSLIGTHSGQRMTHSGVIGASLPAANHQGSDISSPTPSATPSDLSSAAVPARSLPAIDSGSHSVIRSLSWAGGSGGIQQPSASGIQLKQNKVRRQQTIDEDYDC